MSDRAPAAHETGACASASVPALCGLVVPSLTTKLGRLARCLTNLATAGLLFGAVSAHAAPPGSDPNGPISRWVHTLENQWIATSDDWFGCCSLADCRPTAIRTVDGQLEAWIGKDEYGPTAPEAWLPISERAQKARSDGPPPDGRSWVCYFAGEVKCYAPGWGG